MSDAVYANSGDPGGPKILPGTVFLELLKLGVTAKSVLVMRVVTVQGTMLVVNALAMHELVQLGMRGCQRRADALVLLRFRPWRQRVHKGHRPFNLFQDGDGVALLKGPLAANANLNATAMRCDV